MEQLDALLENACAHADEVKIAADPQETMRELLAPLRDFFLQQSATESKSYELPSDKSDDVEASSASTTVTVDSESPAKTKVPTYLAEAATRIQALVLGNTRTTAARSDTSNSSNDGTVLEPVKSLGSNSKQNMFSGAASRFQAFVRGNNAANQRESSAMIVLSPVVGNPKDRTFQKLQLGAAATRIQALVRGKTERNSFIQQRSFLLQGTKVSWLYIVLLFDPMAVLIDSLLMCCAARFLKNTCSRAIDSRIVTSSARLMEISVRCCAYKALFVAYMVRL